MPITIGIGHRFHRPPGTQPDSPRREHKDPGRDVRADHLGVAQMTERGPDQKPLPGIVQKKKRAAWR